MLQMYKVACGKLVGFVQRDRNGSYAHSLHLLATAAHMPPTNRGRLVSRSKSAALVCLL